MLKTEKDTVYYVYCYLTKYRGSLNNLSRANGDFREQIFAREIIKTGNEGMYCNLLKNEAMRVCVLLPGTFSS